MSRKRLTKRRSDAMRRLLDQWYISYERIGAMGRLEIWGVPLSQINMEAIRDLYIENIKSSAEIGDWFQEDLDEAIREAEELYQKTLDD
jgi:hypothetical protein